MLVNIRPLTGSSGGGGGGGRKPTVEFGFEVEPCSKVAIQPHSFIYTTVTFHPTTISAYPAILEVIPDSGKARPLAFEIQGEGNLPQVSIVKPTLRNSKGNHCLLYQRLSLQHHQTLPFTLKNTGSIPASLVMEVVSGVSAFQILSHPEEAASRDLVDESTTLSAPVSLSLKPEETADCYMRFAPQGVKKYKGELRVRVHDNIFERLSIQLVGEGYRDDICIDNIRGQVEGKMDELDEVPEDVEGILYTVS